MLPEVPKNWFTQGLVTNLVAAVIIAAPGIAVAVLAKNASPWAMPILSVLGASALIAVSLVAIRNLPVRRHARIIRPTNARTAIRECLDRAGFPVQNSPVDGFTFNYIVSLSGRKIVVGQSKSDPAYLGFLTQLTFTDEDNQRIEAGRAGSAAIVKALRMGLAGFKIGYSGADFPFKTVVINKRIFMGADFGESQFIQVLFEMESAFVLMLEICNPLPA